MFRKIVIIFTMLMSSGLSSQTLDNPWAVDINLNFREYNGDLGNQFLKFNDNNAQIGLGLNHYVKPWLNIRAFGNYGKSFYKGNSPDSGISNTLNISAFNVGLQGQFKLNNGFVLKENARVAPYLGLGLSYWNFKNEDIGNSSKNVLALGVPLSAGINFNINPRVNIRAQTTYNLVFSDKIDQYAKSSNDKLLQYSISVIFNFGNRSKAALKKKDSDKDGVSDRIDRCPGTKIGVAVDEFGCEIISLKANKEIKGIVNNLLFETNQTELKESSK